VKQEIEKAFPGAKVEGNTKGSPRTGAFEITDDKGNGKCNSILINLKLHLLTRYSLPLQVECWRIPYAW
jgi:hypothetical protein